MIQTTDTRLEIAALVRLSYEFEDAEPELAARAWSLAQQKADLIGSSPAAAVTALSADSLSGRTDTL